MKDGLLKLASLLQAMKLAYHNAHHVCGRISFFADHEALGDFYSQLDSDYDGCVERLIGLFGADAASLQPQLAFILAKLQSFPSSAPDNAALFQSLLQFEIEMSALTEQLCKLPECRESEKQLISEFGNKSAIRQYKIKQRLRK